MKKKSARRQQASTSPKASPVTSDMPVETALIRRLISVDEGRAPALLAIKYRRMTEDAFAFFRGSGHLFHADFPKGLKRFPKVWLNGDLHLENFGTYRGENRLTYFDIGDFDEGGIGSASRDLLRFISALHLAMPLLGLAPAKAAKLAKLYLAAYRDALCSGKALWLERRLASGLIGDLMRKLDKRLEAGAGGSAWLRSRVIGAAKADKALTAKKDARTKDSRKKLEKVLDSRHLRLDTGKALAVSPQQRQMVEQALVQTASQQRKLGHGHWQILDIAWRIAGLGTLGLPRFSILVQVMPDHPSAPILSTEGDLLLLDLKLQPGSVMAPHLKRQPRFASEGDRVVAIEKRLQAMNPAFLTAIRMGKGSYTLRELQPEADKLDLKQIQLETGHLDQAELQQAIEMMGRLTAWAQLRSSGRQDSATADELIEFGDGDSWVAGLLDAGARVAGRQRDMWQASRDWLLAESARLSLQAT
jgi:uncharacterized protein (DUF2252 family)